MSVRLAHKAITQHERGAMINAYCDLPASEQPEIVPDSVPVVPSLLDEYRRVFEEFGSTFIDPQRCDSGTVVEFHTGGKVHGTIVIRMQDSDEWARLRIEARVGDVYFSGFIPLEQLPRFKAAIRAALETP